MRCCHPSCVRHFNAVFSDIRCLQHLQLYCYGLHHLFIHQYFYFGIYLCLSTSTYSSINSTTLFRLPQEFPLNASCPRVSCSKVCNMPSSACSKWFTTKLAAQKMHRTFELKSQPVVCSHASTFNMAKYLCMRLHNPNPTVVRRTSHQ